MTSKPQGFSLIEVLLALSISAVAIVVLAEAFVNTLWALSMVEEQPEDETRYRFVRSQVLLEPDLDTFEQGGNLRLLDGSQAFWEAEVEYTDTTDLFLVELTIELRGLERAADRVRVETFYLLRPSWSEAVERSIRRSDAEDRIEDVRRTWDWPE